MTIYLPNCLFVQTELADSCSSFFLDNLLKINPPGKIPASPNPSNGNPVLGNSVIEDLTWPTTWGTPPLVS